MTALQDAFAIAKKILLVSEQIDRLTEDTRKLSGMVTDHEIRLAVIETTLDITRRKHSLTLPGN